MKIFSIKTRNTADGDIISIPIFQFIGTNNIQSPSLYIQSSIHGSEVQGYLIAIKLIQYFIKNPPLGNVTIIPIANPYGLNYKLGEYTFGRFDPISGNNWNRNYIDLSLFTTQFFKKFCQINNFNKLTILFKKFMKNLLKQQLKQQNSYAKKLALELQSIAITADIVLDLHCDTVSIPHIYSPTYSMESATKLNIPFIIEIPHIFNGALDEAIFYPWISLIEHFNKKYPDNIIKYSPIEAFTIECGCHEYINKDESKKQMTNILNYLNFKNIINNKDLHNSQQEIFSCKLKDFITLYAKFGGIIIDNVKLGTKIKKNNKIFTFSIPNKNINQQISDKIKYIYSNKTLIPITKTPTPIILEGMTLMKAMTNFIIFK